MQSPGGDSGTPQETAEGSVDDEFNAYAVVVSAESHGWEATTPDDVFDFVCFPDAQEKAPRCYTKHLAPTWAKRAATRAGRGSRALNDTRPILSEKGLSPSSQRLRKNMENRRMGPSPRGRRSVVESTSRFAPHPRV